MEFQITSASAIHIAIKLFWYWLNILIVAVEVRFLVNWFLNINPYFEPFLSLWAWTNPVFCFGRSLYPKVLGIDVTPLVNYRVLAWFQRIVDNYVHGVNDILTENDDMSDFDNNEQRLDKIKKLNFLYPELFNKKSYGKFLYLFKTDVTDSIFKFLGYSDTDKNTEIYNILGIDLFDNNIKSNLKLSELFPELLFSN